MEALAYIHVAAHYEELNSSSEVINFEGIKLNALQVVKSAAIAVGCITVGVVPGIAAEALSTSGGKLTLRNDTQSEVLIFLHQDGKSGAYTRYVYLPACTERTMLGDYSQGWHISQDLRWKLPLIPTRMGIAKVYTSSFNGVKYEKLCQQATRSVSDTYTSLLGWGTKPAPATTVSVNLRQLGMVGMVTAENLDNVLNAQTLAQAKKIPGAVGELAEKTIRGGYQFVTELPGAFNDLKQTIFGGTKEVKKGAEVISSDYDVADLNWFIQQKRRNADQFFDLKAFELLAANTFSDKEIKTTQRIRSLRELADSGNLDEIISILTNICKVKPSYAMLYAQLLIKAAQISNSQNLAAMNKPVKEGSTMVEVKRTGGGLEGLSKEMIKERYCPKSDGENRQRVERKNYI